MKKHYSSSLHPRLLAGGALLFVFSAAAGAVAAPAASKEGAAFFTSQVQPILQAKCIVCHSGAKPQGGLDLTSREALLKGGAAGPAAIPGNTAGSLLVKAVRFQGPKMPPQGMLPKEQIEIIEKWVAVGLPWAGEIEAPRQHLAPAVNAESRKFWAYQPVRRPAAPPVKSKWWPLNPIDSFILAKLEKQGLRPSGTASREALIRRVTYDLTGLPPSPEEVQRFLHDGSPQAWERLVDRLLASPQYGEKWGRHWLDLVRYAESDSYERDAPKPHVWRYRDYVIDSFNSDKPYDQFIREQLAGDEMPDRTPEKMVATGYYRLGIWDDEPADPKQALYDDLDDIARTTSEVFLGVTLGCARCHDHKLDPLPQRDYYRFLSFFNGIRRYGVRSPESVAEASLRSIATSEEEQRFAAESAEHRKKLDETSAGIDQIEAKVQGDLTPVEREEWRNENARLDILKPRAGKLLTIAEFDRYRQLLQERRALRAAPPRGVATALVVTEEKDGPRPTHVLGRGSAHAEGDLVQPGFPSVLGFPDPALKPSPQPGSSGRRSALADWVASPANPLTARVMANRIWQHHFGRGLVKSSNDFGFAGDRPTHPELLDWLASELTGGGWRLKRLHRLILTSNAYKMSSKPNAAALEKDPVNDLYWRFPVRRLTAEEVRDSILAVNGSLNLKMGGPSIYQDLPEEVLAGQSRPGENWGKSSPAEQRRRSIYIHVKRSLSVPIIAAFDGADTDFTCPVRFSTTQPTQALGMLNSQWVNDQARVMATHLKQQAGDVRARQVESALWRVLQRKPQPREVERGAALIESLVKDHGMSEENALAYFCVLALNLNEFFYLD